ncbi:hypothetical protein ACFL0M_07565 [Thermodesulfobacteriota bacterium]
MKKKIDVLILGFFLLCLSAAPAADVSGFLNVSDQNNFPILSRAAQKEVLQKRAEEVIDANDALIQKTIQAHGGNYFREGQNKILIFNQNIYKDFSIRVIKGQRLIVETADGTFVMNVVKE